MISRERARRLKPLLDALHDSRPWAERVRADPVEFAHRYEDPRDVEVVALLSASLAYGKATLFKPKIEQVLSRLGPAPANRLEHLEVKDLGGVLDGFVYRFNLPADLGVLLMGMGACLRQHRTLEAVFLEARATGDWRASLSGFSQRLRDAADVPAIVKALGRVRGLDHLLPVGGGAAKRLSLFLRWMVRGPDEIDLGIWKQVSPRELVIPLDTHIARLSTWLGLTSRRTQGWAMAEEITASLRLLDAADPVRYDFALCHLGMSGACPVRPAKVNCRRCPLVRECRTGQRLLRS